MQTPLLGQVWMAPYNFAPLGSMFCNGQLLPISQYSALFSLIGTTYGGDGQSTFALPDLRGRGAISQGQGQGLQNYVLGEPLGVETVTLVAGQLPAHSHNAACVSGNGNLAPPTGALWAGSANNTNIYLTGVTPDTPLASNAIQPAGSSIPHENHQPLLVINFVIAVDGLFPSRN
jgi:microcystin-dependent protein